MTTSNERHERKAPLPKKLTLEQKKVVWSKPKANAGAGWVSAWDRYQGDLYSLRLQMMNAKDTDWW